MEIDGNKDEATLYGTSDTYNIDGCQRPDYYQQALLIIAQSQKEGFDPRTVVEGRGTMRKPHINHLIALARKINEQAEEIRRLQEQLVNAQNVADMHLDKIDEAFKEVLDNG